MSRNPNPLPASPIVAVVGATGAVGGELIRVLEQRRFPLSRLRFFASARSAGKTLAFRGEQILVEELTEESFRGVDIALFSAGSAASKRYSSAAVEAGCIVIDNSSAYRMDADVPLVVPEINTAALAGHKGIIANPNCAAIVSIVPLWPVHRRNRIRRLIISTYQAASGGGAAAMAELEASTRAYLAGEEYPPQVLLHPYAFNLFSHNTRIDPETGYNDEETKVIHETRKIWGEPDLCVSATCIRVPILRAHSMSITFECEAPISPVAARAIIGDAPGVRLVDDREANYFPMPRDASGEDDILVGRIRRDLSDPSGHSISLFVCGDQLLKGAALNAVQIAEALLRA